MDEQTLAQALQAKELGIREALQKVGYVPTRIKFSPTSGISLELEARGWQEGDDKELEELKSRSL
jgi:hypothetical protein